MASTLTYLQPSAIWRFFDEITRIPRPSKKEGKIITYLIEFARSRGLSYRKDLTGNVVILKNATPGLEERPKVVLQSHMDMVTEKNNDVHFDFEHDAIRTRIENGWVKAEGTTLGADCGIGMAAALAILDAQDIPHGPLECLFTRDEETGLTGAAGLKSGFMSGDYLINLDSEDEGQIFVSCAGGARTTAEFAYDEIPVPEGYFTFKVEIKGLTGGHSGDDINKKRANANKLLVRFLLSAFTKYDLYLVDIQSGGLHNAIPREGYAICAVPMTNKESIRVDLNLLAAEVEEEYSRTEPSVQFLLESAAPATTAVDKDTTRRLLLSLQALHNGIFAMSQDLDWLVETSSNLASVRREAGAIVVTTSQRSSIGSARENMSTTVRATFELAGAKATTNEGYPGWKMNPNSEILKIATESYKRLFGKEPKILAIHAGLECGLFSEKYPHLDMISVGPTLRGVHSPDERLYIPSVQLVWDHLLDILKHIPAAE